MTAPKHVPRFIPTLTEVVDPTSLHGLRERRQPDLQALVQQVQRELQPWLERRLQQEFEQFQRTVLTDQWQVLQQRLQQDFAERVRQAVAYGVEPDDDGIGLQTVPRVSTDS